LYYFFKGVEIIPMDDSQIMKDEYLFESKLEYPNIGQGAEK